MPEITVLIGYIRYVIEVTMPKLPPPPFRAQNKSACWLALARISSPLATTTSYESVLSQASPHRPISHPTPPPRVSPATPVLEISPPVVASPYNTIGFRGQIHPT